MMASFNGNPGCSRASAECILYAVILDFILVLYATSGHLRLTLVFLNQDGTAVIMKRERRVDITNTQQ